MKEETRGRISEFPIGTDAVGLVTFNQTIWPGRFAIEIDRTRVKVEGKSKAKRTPHRLAIL